VNAEAGDNEEEKYPDIAKTNEGQSRRGEPAENTRSKLSIRTDRVIKNYTESGRPSQSIDTVKATESRADRRFDLI
jgi:hypothetical protein